MGPQSNETGINLPPPISGEQAPAHSSQEASQSGIEQGGIGGESAPSAAHSDAPMLAMPVLPVASPLPQIGTQDDVSTTTNSTTQTNLDDQDLIEKEWVNKAKQIVERTRDDPYKQSEELTVVKADYMKKRYDKNIKVSK